MNWKHSGCVEVFLWSFGWRSLRDNVECFIQCHNYALPFIIQKQYSCSNILMWSKHLYSYFIFNTFDKIRVFVRTINLFIHLASDLYIIHSAFSRTSPNSTRVTDVHCTNPVIDNKRSCNDQKRKFLKIHLKIENCLQHLRFGVFSDETVPSSDFLTKQIVRNSNWYV